MEITKEDVARYKAKLARQSRQKRNIKDYARNRTRQEIAKGKIDRQPCLICSDTPTEAHHINYENPSEVIFLCKYHHTVLHYYKQLREKGEIAPITQNCLRKYHEIYKKLHKY